MLLILRVATNFTPRVLFITLWCFLVFAAAVAKEAEYEGLRKELRVQKEEVQRLCCEVRALREAMSKERDKKSRKEGTERIQRALKRDREAWERGGGRRGER